MDVVLPLLVVGGVLGAFGVTLYLFAGSFLNGRFKSDANRRRDQRHKPLN